MHSFNSVWAEEQVCPPEKSMHRPWSPSAHLLVSALALEMQRCVEVVCSCAWRLLTFLHGGCLHAHDNVHGATGVGEGNVQAASSGRQIEERQGDEAGSG